MYDHNIKAGNQGDVIKHTALIAAASVLMDKIGGTFHYADTYAGYAYNPLKSDGEWRSGIGVLHDSGHQSENPAIHFWQGLWECKSGLRGSVYPGSSLFMLKLCMKRDLACQTRLWDISPTVISQLVTFYDQDEVEIFPRSATVEDFADYKPDLLLIDPPDFNDVDKALNLFGLVKNVILWLPVVYENGAESEASLRAFHKCQNREIPIVDVSWQSERNTRGCRLLFQLPEEASQSLKNTTCDTAKLMGWEIDCDA